MPRLTFWPVALRHPLDPGRPAVRGGWGGGGGGGRAPTQEREAIARLLSGAVTTFWPVSALSSSPFAPPLSPTAAGGAGRWAACVGYVCAGGAGLIPVGRRVVVWSPR